MSDIKAREDELAALHEQVIRVEQKLRGAREVEGVRSTRRTISVFVRANTLAPNGVAKEHRLRVSMIARLLNVKSVALSRHFNQQPWQQPQQQLQQQSQQQPQQQQGPHIEDIFMPSDGCFSMIRGYVVQTHILLILAMYMVTLPGARTLINEVAEHSGTIVVTDRTALAS